MNNSTMTAKEIVTSFIEALNGRNLKSARGYVSDNYSVRAPGASYDSAEAYLKDTEKAQQKYNGRYEIKKVFADGNDVFIVNDVVSGNPQYPSFTALGLFHVEGQKIRSARFVYESGSSQRSD